MDSTAKKLCSAVKLTPICFCHNNFQVELEPIKDRVYTEIVDKFHMCTTFTKSKASTMMEVLDFVEKE
jgi:hypothetical protein